MSDSDGDQEGGFLLSRRVGIGGRPYWGGVEVVEVIYSSCIHRIIECFY